MSETGEKTSSNHRVFIWTGLAIWALAIGLYLTAGQEPNIVIQLFGLAGIALLVFGLVKKFTNRR